jgi:hypothetical protein
VLELRVEAAVVDGGVCVLDALGRVGLVEVQESVGVSGRGWGCMIQLIGSWKSLFKRKTIVFCSTTSLAKILLTLNRDSN